MEAGRRPLRFAFEGIEPELAVEGCFIAPTAVVIGRVRLAKDASVWFGAVLRGDGEPIVVGEGSNIQDGCVLHTDPGFPVEIGRFVTVGHSAVVHGCTIGDGSLIGIGATILSGARIGCECLIAAGCLVPEGMEIPDRRLVMGVPARIVGEVRTDQLERMRRGAQVYIDRWKRYRATLHRLD